jgi:hypothetical protein
MRTFGAWPFERGSNDCSLSSRWAAQYRAGWLCSRPVSASEGTDRARSRIPTELRRRRGRECHRTLVGVISIDPPFIPAASIVVTGRLLECAAVADASPELIKSSDLLVVGGTTHIRGMTSGFRRKMGVGGEEKLEAQGEPAHQMERMPKARGPGFDSLPKVSEGGSAAAAFDTRLPSPLAGGATPLSRRLLHQDGKQVSKCVRRHLSAVLGRETEANTWLLRHPGGPNETERRDSEHDGNLPDTYWSA